MQIVINLSDKTYKDIIEENGIYGTDNGLSARITGKVVGAIQSGTPLEQKPCEDAIEKLPPVTPAQAPILDKIRAEIRELATFDTVDVLVEVNRIIDKYKESEDKYISGKERSNE